MTVLLFRPEYEPGILDGRKVQTFGRRRKVAVRVLDGLSLRVWTGRPYHSAQRVLLDTRCTSSYEAVLDDGGMGMLSGPKYGRRLSWEQLEQFARRDGFESFAAMHKHFREQYGLPFDGSVIGWD